MTSAQTPPRWVSRLMVVLWWYLLVGGVLAAAMLTESAGWTALAAVAPFGIWTSWRHLRGRQHLALAPAYSQPLTMLGVISLMAAISEAAFVRWLWAAMLPIGVFALLGEHRRRTGRPWWHDRWIAEHLTRPQLTSVIFGVTALGTLGLGVWTYLHFDPIVVIVPALALLMLAGGHWFALRQIDSAPPVDDAG